MERVEKFLNNVAAGIILTAMMLLVTSDVVGRYLFNRPIHGTTELTEFMMIGLVYFSLAYTQTLKAHIRVELLLSYISPRTKIFFEELTYLLGFVLFALITWQTLEAAIKACRIWETTFGLILFPLFPAKVLVPIGSFIVCLRFGLDFINGLKRLRQGETHVEP